MSYKSFFTFILLCALSSHATSEELVGAMGCEVKPDSTKYYDKTNLFVTLYKENGNYSKICWDNIDEIDLEPMTCWRNVWLNASYIETTMITINRKTLDMKLFKHYYSCKKSPDPKSVENFIRNSKMEQLNNNQF